MYLLTGRYRHIDAALYALSPPKVTTLYAVSVPSGEPQVCRYDDGSGDEVKVPLGGTVCEHSNAKIPLPWLIEASRQWEDHV